MSASGIGAAGECSTTRSANRRFWPRSIASLTLPSFSTVGENAASSTCGFADTDRHLRRDRRAHVLDLEIELLFAAVARVVGSRYSASTICPAIPFFAVAPLALALEELFLQLTADVDKFLALLSLDVSKLDDVPAFGRLHGIADLACLQPEESRLEGLIGETALQPAKVSAGQGRTRVLRALLRDRGEIGALGARLIGDRLRDRLSGALGIRVGVGSRLDQNVAKSAAARARRSGSCRLRSAAAGSARRQRSAHRACCRRARCIRW